MSTPLTSDDNAADRQAGYEHHDGIWTRQTATHRESEYDSRGFTVLAQMQEEHFWYVGRRRFITRLLERHLPSGARRGRRVIDLGAGCGGFVRHVLTTELFRESRFAVGDSSLDALTFCRQTLVSDVSEYQIDLLQLGWTERWDVAFLLDVLEHIPDDAGALAEVYRALTPGGYCLLTVPALQQFWSWNDEIVGHQRRYSVPQLHERLTRAGFRVLDARYFMFLLSPLLLASRLASGRRVETMSEAERWVLVERSHAVPIGPVNQLLRRVFELETPLGHRVSFPWGTSAIALCQKI